MKRISIIAVMSFLFCSLDAQVINYSLSNIEQFIKSNGKTIGRYPVYKSTILSDSEFRLGVYKYFEISGRDTLLGILISARKDMLSSVDISYNLYKTIEGYLDYGEIPRIISWMNLVKEKYLTVDSEIDYISYTPAVGNVIMYFTKEKIIGNTKGKANIKWRFAIQADKNDSNTIILVKDLNVVMNELETIQKHLIPLPVE